MKVKDYGPLALGETLQLNFSSIVGYDGNVIADLAASSITFEFTVKDDFSDTDAAAIREATVGSGVTLNGGIAEVQVIDASTSAGLTLGEVYYFEGWMKEPNQPVRMMSLGSYYDTNLKDNVDYVRGKFRAVTALNATKTI